MMDRQLVMVVVVVVTWSVLSGLQLSLERVNAVIMTRSTIVVYGIIIAAIETMIMIYIVK